MANQQMIDSWQRGQDHYPQARYFTPGQQQTQYRTTERGQARTMDLLVVVHNDVPAADIGLQRVDLIVNSGRHDRAAEHGNGHLVNRHDEQAGITDHTALYDEQDMGRIHQANGRPPIPLSDRDGEGPPGAEIYSIKAKLRTNERGELVVDTAQPISPGSGASVYSLHDVHEGMVKAQQSEGLAQQIPSPAIITEVPGVSNVEQPSRPVLRNSQAGLAAAQGPKNSYPSVPRPGAPGSRFNATVRERPAQPVREGSPDMIRSSDVPRSASAAQPNQPMTGPSKEQNTGKRRLPSAGTVGRVGMGGAQGAAMGLKATAAIPHPIAKGVGAAGGAVIGGAMAAGGKSNGKAGIQTPAKQAGQVNVSKGNGGRAKANQSTPADDMAHFRTKSGQVISMGQGRLAKKGAPDNSRQMTSDEYQAFKAESKTRAYLPQSDGSKMPVDVPAQPKKLPTSQRLRESKVGQVVQSEGFQSGAKRVGTEAMRDAATEADRAKRAGASNKGVIASAAKGAATGTVRGVRTEMSNRNATKVANKPQEEQASSSPDAGMADRLGKSVGGAKSISNFDKRPVSETFDYQFEQAPEPGGSESQLGS